MSLSLDLRERALAALASGMSHTQVAALLGISRMTLYRWQERQAQGNLAPGRSCGGPRKIVGEQEALLLTQLQQNPDVTLEEHVRLWHQQQEQQVSRATMARAIKRVKWTYKKRVSAP